MTTLEDLHRNYRVAFLRYLGGRDEAALRAGYELGRAAVAERISVLELAQIHHAVLLEVLRDPRPDVALAATAASEFFLEVLATYDMVQRGYRAEA